MASLQKVIFTIPAAGQDSNEIGGDQLRNCRAMSVMAPATLTGTVTVESGDDDVSGANFATVQSPPGTDVTVAADKTTVFTVTPFPRFRLHSSIAEAADRTFIAWLSLGE